MKHIYISLLLCLSFIACAAQINSTQHSYCYTDEKWAHMAQLDPSLVAKRQQMDEMISEYMAAHPGGAVPASRSIGAATVIPTVIYVVYDTATVNISMAQIQSQMDQLNQNFAPSGYSFCYARKNVQTGTAFTPQAGDSAGVFRIQSPLSNVNSVSDAQLKALSTLPSENYLRIYIVHTILPQGVLGYALLPGTSISGDGIVIRSDVFGSNNFCAGCQLLTSYNKGASLTHEAGHYLNLYHTFQGGCNPDTSLGACSTYGDQVCDTPPTDGSFGCPNPAPMSCDGANREMIQNYMDYTDDPCKNSFTGGQKMRMDYAVHAFRGALISTANLINTGVSCVALGNQYADFFCANFNGCTGKAIRFESLGSAGFTYSWSFGDGTTSTGDTLDHTYTAAGTYQVTLTATNTSQNVSVSQTTPVYITACNPISCRMNKWLSNYTYLDFSSGTPIPVAHPDIEQRGNGGFYFGYYRADDQGRPLFSFGEMFTSLARPHYAPLFDSALRVVDSIDPGQEIQVLPIINTPGKYCILMNPYAFTQTSLYIPDTIVYSYVQASNGSVSVLPGKRKINVPLPPGANFFNLGDAMTSIPNCDGTIFWSVVYLQSGLFAVLKVTRDTVVLHQTYTAAGMGYFNLMTASPDGRRIVTGVSGFANNDSKIYLLDFDKSTGTILAHHLLAEEHNAYQFYNDGGSPHMCFSPDSRFLYGTELCCMHQTGNTGYIYQMDLTDADPWAHKQQIYQFERDGSNVNSPSVFMYHGPDGKIYIGYNAVPFSAPLSFRMSVINNPNTLETGANATGFNPKGPYLLPPGLPSSPFHTFGFGYHYDAADAYGCSWHPGVPSPFRYQASGCMSFNFHADDCYSTQWDFGDTLSGAANTSTLSSPAHVFSHDGAYTVRMVSAGYTFTDTVHAGHAHNQIAATVISPCPAPHANYSVSSIRPGVNYSWAITHGTPAAVSGQPSIDVQWSTTDTTGTVMLIAYDPALGCTDTTTLQVLYSISGTASYNYRSAAICQGESYTFGGRTLTTAGTYGDTASLTGGCQIITVLSLSVTAPTVGWQGGPVTLTTVSAPVPLSGGVPAGGHYSGPGVHGDTFYPDSTTYGSHTITYTYTDSNGCTGTATRSYIITGIEDADADDHISLYPNPAHTRLVVESQLFSMAAAQISVYDLMGRQIVVPVASARERTTLDLTGIANGVYTVRISLGGHESTKRFVRME